MIITIDGPAGAGKSTIAKLLAERLNYAFLDTGSMYRAVTLAGIRKNIDWNAPEKLLVLAEALNIEIRSTRTFLDGEDVTEAVRSEDVTSKIKYASDNPGVRYLMVELQRKTAKLMCEEFSGVVTDGRDQGSVVFPDAGCKIFLTATPEERARRRLGEIEKRGETADFGDVLEKINRRDASDSAREVGPLIEPVDSCRVVTDGMDIPAVIEKILEIVRTF